MPTIEENLTTLAQIKADIKTSIINKGVDAGDDITLYGDKIREISGSEIDYFYLEAVEDGAISFEFSSSAFSCNMQYSLDKKNWFDWDFYEIALNAGQRVYFRGNNPNGVSSNAYANFVIPYKTNVGGNLMTLFDYKGETTTIPSFGCYRLFAYQTPGIYDCSNLEMPAINIGENAYGHMFRNSGIVYAPKVLPAEVLTAANAYQQMFNQCAELLIGPEIKAKVLSNNCMQYMFDNCPKLVKATSVLPAPTLATNAYKYMFDNCASLVEAPEIMATTYAENCFTRMFYGCSSLKKAPYLRGKTLVTNCMQQMFYRCSSLQYIKAEFTTAPSTTYTTNWVSGVASNGCFIKANDATWTTKGISACPPGWTLITSVS